MSANEKIEDHGLLRFLTCGSVDDGKSTLIGRLLFDTKTILADTLNAIEQTPIADLSSKPELLNAALSDRLFEIVKARGLVEG